MKLTVKELKEQIAQTVSTRKTTNQDKHNQLVSAILTDKGYQIEDYNEKAEGNKEIHKPAETFLGFVSGVAKKSGLTVEEADKLAEDIKVNKATAAAITKAVREADYLMTAEFNGVVTLVNKKDLHATLFVDNADEVIRKRSSSLPVKGEKLEDNGDRKRIYARKVVKVKNKLRDHMFENFNIND